MKIGYLMCGLATLTAYGKLRVILATNDVPEYIQFWPLTARIWKEVVGAHPTLAYINEKNASLDTSLGDIISFNPIPGVPTSVQAQTIRLLLPTLYPDDICIVSDIDMIPLQKNYFLEPLKKLKSNTFLIYRDGAYGPHHHRYPMCYLAAYGRVFKEIFNKDNKPLEQVIAGWHSHNHGFSTDEKMLTRLVHEWRHAQQHLVKLKDSINAHNRVDRSNWGYDKNLLQQGWYVDAHMLRPYGQYKKEIDQLAYDLTNARVSLLYNSTAG